MASFTNKQLRVTFILAGTNQVFPGTGNNTLIITGLRMSSKVEAVARLSTTLDLKVWGMKKADMDALTVAWANPPVVLNHLVILEANDGRGWVQVFSGTIKEAQAVYRAQPAVYFQVLGMTGYYQKINPAPPTSYPETVDIGVVAGDIVDKMNEAQPANNQFTYVDGGADGVLTNPYFPGTLWDQLKSACAAAKADFYIQGSNILVVPSGKPRQDAPAVMLNRDSGLVGQPEYSGAGLEVIALFDPSYLCGTPLQISGTDLPAADGRWYPVKLGHALDAALPRGQWFTHMTCLRVLV